MCSGSGSGRQRPGGRGPDADSQVHGEREAMQRALPADHQADHRHQDRCVHACTNSVSVVTREQVY